MLKFDKYHNMYFFYNGFAAGRMFKAKALSDFRLAKNIYKSDLKGLIYANA